MGIVLDNEGAPRDTHLETRSPAPPSVFLAPAPTPGWQDGSTRPAPLGGMRGAGRGLQGEEARDAEGFRMVRLIQSTSDLTPPLNMSCCGRRTGGTPC